MKATKIKVIYQIDTVTPEAPVTPAPEIETEFEVDNLYVSHHFGYKKETGRDMMSNYEPNGKKVLLLISAPEDIKEELLKTCTQIIDKMIHTDTILSPEQPSGVLYFLETPQSKANEMLLHFSPLDCARIITDIILPSVTPEQGVWWKKVLVEVTIKQ